MGRFTTLYNSSRAVIFTYFIMIWFSFFYWLGKFFLYRYVLMDDYYQVEKPRDPGSVEYILGNGSLIQNPTTSSANPDSRWSRRCATPTSCDSWTSTTSSAWTTCRSWGWLF